MKIYKLRYENKKLAIADLIDKNVIEIVEQEQSYINGTQAVVECGIITLVYATYDDEGNELKPAVYADGYHYDVMTSDDIIFESEIFVNNPKFKFAGH